MGDLEPITRNEKLWSGEDLTPVTRREMYIKHLYDETQVIPEYPVTREEMFILKAGEELHDVTIEQLTATENKTYSEEGVAYSPVIVNVPLPENAYLLKEIEDVEIATFTDGSDLPMPKLEVAIEPVQDLHGYDAPWVGGAGKNKLNIDNLGNFSNRGIDFVVAKNSSNAVISVSANGTVTVGTYSDYYIVGASDVYDYANIPSGSYILNGAVSSNAQIYIVSENDGVVVYSNGGDTSAFNMDSSKKYRIFLRISGSVSNVKFYPMIRLATVSDATFAPYSNICPIIGWDEANVSVSGVNLLDYDKWKNSSVTRGTAIWEDNGVTITATGNDAYVSPTNSKIFVKEGQTIILKWEESTNKEGAIYLFPNGSTEGMAVINNQTVKNLTYTVPSGATFITFRFGVNNSGETIAYKNIRLEFGNQSPTFVPYNGSTFNIKFPSEAGIVYGATLDVLRGLLTVTHSEVDLGNGNWEQNSYVTSAYNLVVSGIKKGKLNEKSNILCEALATVITGTVTALPNLSIMVANGAPIIVARDDNYISNPTDFKTAMNGVKLVYELATPLTIQLPTTQVKSLQGQNNVWADCGNILDLSYLAKEE